MKVVTWNCNGALRKKTKYLDALGSDIYVVQECENPENSAKDYFKWAGEKYLWVGDNKNKGIGIFARNGHNIQRLNWQGEYSIGKISSYSKAVTWKTEDLQSFLPICINGKYMLLAVWTKQADSPNFGYIGQFWKYLQIHKRHLASENTIICGDLNSNSIWDEPDRWWNHSDVVEELKLVGLQSLYHHIKNEPQGEESQKTFFMYRKIEKSYHIDHIYLSNNLISSSSLIVHDPEEWLKYSDHVPLEFKINSEQNA